MTIFDGAQLLGNIGEFLGAIAVVVTLIYLATQLRESNKLARASSLQSVLDAFSERSISRSISHPETIDIQVRGHHCFEELSMQEQILFSGFINEYVFQHQNVMQLHNHGLVEDVDYETWLKFTVACVKTPGGRSCFNLLKSSYTPTIVSEIETYLKANPSAPSFMELYPRWYGKEGLEAVLASQ